jgi:hypothetical protein
MGYAYVMGCPLISHVKPSERRFYNHNILFSGATANADTSHKLLAVPQWDSASQSDIPAPTVEVRV